MRQTPRPTPELLSFVDGLGLGKVSAARDWTALSGGVSCQAWKVQTPAGAICVKQARARLAVADDWQAPIERALYEYRWFATANEIIPGAAPAPIAIDERAGLIAMSFLDEARHPLWKGQLLAGAVEVRTAAAVGARISAIHAATAGRADIAARFPTDAIFFALRLDPYLLGAAARRPAVAAPLRALVERTAGTHVALVHGDVSPKNILVGPDGPVFLDAETAWWGDPAFDLAFCLNHLLLKCLVVPDAVPHLLDSFSALAGAYLAAVDWEGKAALEARAASLLAGLLLARVDGKSPVEYLTTDDQRDFVRAVAEPLLLAPPSTLGAVGAAWQARLEAAMARTRS